ncbi:MAG: glycosyltransferase family 2 protein, partial [Deltaproteobacteria bacterium]|nr:glycosyltransferase family 2 protein [Deltaproteobacteria bacterium]
MENDQRAEIKEVYRIIKSYHDLQHKHKKISDDWHQSFKKLEKKLQSTQQRFQNELDQILNSRTHRLAVILRDAKYSLRLCLLLPLRLGFFFLPVRFREKIVPIVNRARQKIFQLRYKFRNAKWPLSKPLVSVIIPIYNSGEHIGEAIDSVLAQTWHDFEIIVVGDGSNRPGSSEVLDSLQKKPKTRVLRQENLKLPAARNRGIRAAQG